MRNIDRWQPTKFVQTSDGLRASRDAKHIGIGSRFIGDLLAQQYERLIRKYATGRILDLGCGHVPLYGMYRDLVEETICVDWENTLHINPFLDQTADLNGKLPFASSSFETVLMTDVLEHLNEPSAAICQVAEILQVGGKLIIGVPFFYWLHEQPHDYYRFTEYALRRFCDRAVLRIVELTPYGGLPEILIDLTSKGIVVLPPSVFTKLLRLAHTALSNLGKTSLCRRISERTKTTFPLGYVLVAEKLAAQR